jgi:glyoxylase-like metal-dependent hydrolase (beta-lactamase superfamily II)
MFGVVPKTLWSQHQPADELNRIEAAFNCLVVDTGKQRILIETGGGVRHDARARERMRLEDPTRLRVADLDPDSIDLVINTHLHWDHCSGNTVDRDGHTFPAFPQARYLTQRGEVEHAREQHPRDRVSYLAVNYEPLIASGRMHLIDGDTEVAPGVDVQVAPGHNRDMMVVFIRSRGETLCHLADLCPYACQITPTWVAGFDLFPLETIASKQSLLTRAAREAWWLSFGHDPLVQFARIAESGGKWRLVDTRPAKINL